MRERRFKKTRKMRRVFLVICEGETEQSYIKMLQQHFRRPVTIKTKVSGNAISARLVSQYRQDLNLEKDDDCSVFFVYDSDVPDVVAKLQTLQGNTILSNPCIELWFFLHVKDFNKAVTSEDLLKNHLGAHPLWKTYVKGKFTNDQQTALLKNYTQAATRAARLSYPDNPSSNMIDFIRALEKS